MIPEAFISQIRGILGEETDAFIRALAQPPVRGIRFQPGRPCDLTEGVLDPVPWFPGMYTLDPLSNAGKHPLHEAGAFYLQDPSAAAAAAVLDPHDGERVLDLCAAPGGKTTALSALAPASVIVANEIVPDRARVLSANAERLGCSNVIVTNESPERLAKRWPGFFDAVLVDAPCSGEGMFRRHPETITEWTPDAPEACARRQKLILDSAALLIRPGGRLCYSTCTFNRQENEERIAAFLSGHPDFSPASFSLPVIGASINGCLRLWPHRCSGEGHFIALLNRNSADDALPPAPAANGGLPRPDAADLREAETFLLSLTDDTLTINACFAEGLWQVPGQCPDLHGIRVLRPGLRLLRRQGKTLLPDHALSHAVNAKKTVGLTDDQAAAYLHGEVLTLPTLENGWTQALYRHWPLGWGKQSQGTFKNHYPKGLRK